MPDPENQQPEKLEQEQQHTSFYSTENDDEIEKEVQQAFPSPQKAKSKMSDLDADIEKELEEALAGFDPDALLAEEPQQPASPAKGEGRQLKKGVVLSIHGDDVFVDVGGRSQGVISLEQFEGEPPQVGDEVEVTIEGFDSENGLLLLSKKGAAVQVDWSSVEEGLVVEARVTGHNKGGLEVEVNNICGFIPISQIELFRVEDLGPYTNERLRCVVTEANRERKNLVLSRRLLLEQEREAAREKLWQEINEGQVREGVVRSIKEYGAFIDLGGVDGLLPISEMSWSRIKTPTEVVKEGQHLKVVVNKVDRDSRKVSLGLKQLLDSPWDDIHSKYSLGELVKGTVTRIMDYGAFVELEPGLEGLIHISELAHHRVRSVSEIVQVGEEVEVRILDIDTEKKRIGLSLKEATTAPAAEETEESGEEGPPAQQLPPLKKQLKGGLG